jgi:hypothetical protein
MRNFALLFCLSLLIGCTENKGSYVQYKYFEFEVDNAVVSSEKLTCDMQRTDEGIKLKYCIESKCINYWLRDTIGTYISETGDTLDLLFTDETEYRVNGTVYPVKRFTLDKNAIDSESQHYWSPEFGIILIKTTTWGGLKIMTQTNFGNQDILHTLTTVLLKDVLVQKINEKSEAIDSITVRMIEDELR